MLFLSSDSSAAWGADLKKQEGFELSGDSSAAPRSKKGKRVRSELSGDSSAAPRPRRGKRVRFHPSVYMPEHSEMRPVKYPKGTPGDRLRQESRALASLSSPGTRLNKMKTKAMKILIPGDPWYSSPTKTNTETPTEEIRNESIRRWKEYDLDRCIADLWMCYKCFTSLSDDSSFDQSTRSYYKALQQAALAFANAFDRLKEGLLPPDQIMKTLEEYYFVNNPKAQQVREGYFYAVETRLKSELFLLSIRGRTERWEPNRLQKPKKTHPKFSSNECCSVPVFVLGCVLVVLQVVFFSK
jgi:hypothetical protein